MRKYSKFFVAAFGIGALIGLRHFEVDIPGLDAVVRDLIVGALVAGGVYQIPNQPAGE
ncbi:hypothetical protein GGQ99_001274 [Aminobacter niigataensis]|uniref:XapX domain-containing protein n=1 Tax=Aminobacter niigataensis TaxID=83265 RepID=A0ABR6KYE6_9HYPH|nr:hypothetical protein [Aminobacter niigataensis]MBB4649552.1 hypothetical protein [Aminobacter niigataensis]